MKFEYIDWYDVQELCEQIGAKLKDEYDAVIGISRGGVVPARIIADVIGVSRYGTITTQHYDHDTYGKYKNVGIVEFKLAKDLKHILVVDDIYDSGDTLKALAKIFRSQKLNVTFVTLLSKQKIAKVNDYPLYYGRLVKNWVVYPWETQEINRVAGR